MPPESDRARAETARKGGPRDAGGGEHGSGPERRLECGQRGVQPAVEEDQRERRRAYSHREAVILEIDSERAFAARHHPDAEEAERHRQTDAARGAAQHGRNAK